MTEEQTALLTEFSVNGVPIAGRTLLGGEPPAYDDEHVTVSLVSAYVSPVGEHLSIVFETTNGSSGEFYVTGEPTYVTEDGQELSPFDYGGQPEVPPRGHLPPSAVLRRRGVRRNARPRLLRR